MNYKIFGIGVLAGIAVTALVYPLFFNKALERNRLISDNGHIERHNKVLKIINPQSDENNANNTENA